MSFWLPVLGLLCGFINFVIWFTADRAERFYVPGGKVANGIFAVLIVLSTVSAVLSLARLAPLGSTNVFVGLFLICFNLRSAYQHLFKSNRVARV
jgi:hypothetical protein